MFGIAVNCVWFCSLGSGSRGNAHVVRDDNTLLLFDCGFNLPTLRRRLAKQALTLSMIDAIFISHEHRDHSKGIVGLKGAVRAPVYMSAGTAQCLNLPLEVRYLSRHQTVVVGDFTIKAIPVPHDGAEPLQFTISHPSGGLAILTDMGHVTKVVTDAATGFAGMIVECNYDEKMLETGRYPQHLRERIASRYGHLSNNEASQLVQSTKGGNGGRKIIAAHLSQENNTADKALLALQQADKDAQITVARQDEPTEWIKINE